MQPLAREQVSRSACLWSVPERRITSATHPRRVSRRCSLVDTGKSTSTLQYSPTGQVIPRHRADPTLAPAL